MLAPRWCFFGYLGRCCGILAPRWRTEAPRRGKIGELRRRGLLLGGRNPRGGTRGAPLHPPKNGFSRMGLQKGSPDSDSNWNWIWKTGGLEDWKTGGQENWRTGGLEDCVDIVHATVPAARWRIICFCQKSISSRRIDAVFHFTSIRHSQKLPIPHI